MILISQSRGLYRVRSEGWRDHFVLETTISWTSTIWACLLVLLAV